MSTRPEHVLDLAGLNCPLPVLKARKALSGLETGAVLVAVCTDPMAEIDIPEMAQTMGAIIIEKEKSDGRTIFRIEKR
ncbi:MAG: sulfurtransferase TusA family protein [Pseudomonadota bacterium]